MPTTLLVPVPATPMSTSGRIVKVTAHRSDTSNPSVFKKGTRGPTKPSASASKEAPTLKRARIDSDDKTGDQQASSQPRVDAIDVDAAELPPLLDVSDDEDGDEDGAEDGDKQDDSDDLQETRECLFPFPKCFMGLPCFSEKLDTFKVPIYAFFHPEPVTCLVDGRPCQVFKCAAAHCKYSSHEVRRYLDKKDAKSTGNLCKHATRCFGEEAIKQVSKAASAADVRKSGVLASGQYSQAIDVMFERTGKGNVSYSHRQHTSIETRSVERSLVQQIN
jgi:hypothetical protein